MKLLRSTSPAPHPIVLWLNLATQTSEMLVASSQVISHRLTRLALAGVVPSARDRKEFTLMGQEKIEAAAESLQAMTARIIALSQQAVTQTTRYWLDASSQLMSIFMSPSLPHSLARQADLLNAAMRNMGQFAARSSGDLAALAHHGLKPIHTRATGNAKRLRVVPLTKPLLKT